MTKSKFKAILTVLLVLFLSVSLASAFGVTSPFWDKRPLVIHPGEEQQVTLMLQNMVGGEDLTFKAVITDGADLAKLTDLNKEYLVPFNANEVPVNLLITIPKNYPYGNDQKVSVSFTQVVNNQEGKMIQMGGGVKTIIPLVIIPVESSQDDITTAASSSVVFSTPIIIASLLAVLIMIIVLALLIGKNRKIMK